MDRVYLSLPDAVVEVLREYAQLRGHSTFHEIQEFGDPNSSTATILNASLEAMQNLDRMVFVAIYTIGFMDGYAHLHRLGSLNSSLSNVLQSGYCDAFSAQEDQEDSDDYPPEDKPAENTGTTQTEGLGRLTASDIKQFFKDLTDE